MNEAPTPLFSEKIIIKEEKTFKKDNFIINIGKSEINSQIIIKIVYPNEINVAKKIFSFDDFIKLIKPLKINENVDELYLNLIELFNKNEFSIKENEEKLEILINIYNNQGIKENYSIFFDEKEKDNEHIQKNIIKKIMQLEKDNKLLKDENKKLSEELNNLKKQIEGINKILFKNIIA